MRKPLQISRTGGGWSHYEIATACVFLACKSEEALRKLSIVVDAATVSYTHLTLPTKRIV